MRLPSVEVLCVCMCVCVQCVWRVGGYNWSAHSSIIGISVSMLRQLTSCQDAIRSCLHCALIDQECCHGDKLPRRLAITAWRNTGSWLEGVSWPSCPVGLVIAR